jgi:hypothetical protein
MLIVGGLLVVALLAIIGIVLLAIDRQPAPKAKVSAPAPVQSSSRATIPLQQMDEEEFSPPPVYDEVRDDSTKTADTVIASAEEQEATHDTTYNAHSAITHEQLYEINQQLQLLRQRVEALEQRQDQGQLPMAAFDRYADNEDRSPRTVPVTSHNDSY